MKLVLLPSPALPPEKQPPLLQCEKAPNKQCFGKPSMKARKCCGCRDFDLCFSDLLNHTKQGRIRLQ